jgi:hypothetical protein
MSSRRLFLAFLLANCSAWLVAADRHKCSVTRPSNPPFVPPAPYSVTAGTGEFYMAVLHSGP